MSPNVVPSRTSNETSWSAQSSSARDRAVRIASRLSHPMTRGFRVSEDDAARTHDHVMVNRASWDDDAPNWVERGRTSWASEPRWGIWGVPESKLGLLPDDLAGLAAVEIGGGTGYVSAWLARRGAPPVALDNSSR